MLITLNVKLHLKGPLKEKRVTWQMCLLGGLAHGRMTVLTGKRFAQVTLARCFGGKILHDAAKLILKACFLESGLAKVRRMKLPLFGGRHAWN